MTELLEILRKASNLEPDKYACIHIALYPRPTGRTEMIRISIATHSYCSRNEILGHEVVPPSAILEGSETALNELLEYVNQEKP